MITAQVAGEDMNKFKLAAKDKADKVTPSGATLTGGVGEVKENKVLADKPDRSSRLGLGRRSAGRAISSAASLAAPRASPVSA